MKIFVKDNKETEEVEITIVGDEECAEVKDVVQLLNTHLEASSSKCIGTIENSQYILNVNEIAFFESRNQQVIAHVENREYIIKDKLYETEKKYPNFMRISKWCVINMNLVSRVYSPFNMTMNISFKSTEVTQVVTRKYLKAFKERILGK